MIIKGKVFILGDHLNTDEIIAARYLSSDDRGFLGGFCLEDIRPGFGCRPDVPGSILLAGHNFGCGSSREHAPMAILGCGIRAVAARSFARIFLRNALNIGLPIVELPIWQDVEEGDELCWQPNTGLVSVSGKDILWRAQAYPSFLREVIKSGGWLKYLLSRPDNKFIT